MSRREPEQMGDLLRRVLGRLGLHDLDSWRRIRDDWSELVEDPWRTHGRPLALADGRLVVEASSPGAVSLLRYGTAGLMAQLEHGLGPGIVTAVEVRRPGRRSDP